ncbi:unnamed protein product [Gadus morhua 'NCC']
MQRPPSSAPPTTQPHPHPCSTPEELSYHTARPSHEKVGLGGSMSPSPLVKRGRRVSGKTVVVQRSCDDFGTRDLNSIGRWADAVS